MSEFEARLLAAKAEMQQSKIQATKDILGTKTAVSLIPEDPNPVISTDDEGFSLHKDGTYSFVDDWGIQQSGMSEVDARRYQAYAAERVRAKEAGAPKKGLHNLANQTGQVLVDLGIQGASQFAGFQSFDQIVEANNYGRPNYRPTQADVEKYKQMRVDPDFAQAQEEFRKSPVFQNLEKDYAKFEQNRAKQKAITAFGDKLKPYIPADYSDSAAAQVAFKTIAKNDGVLSAAWSAMQNDLGTLVQSGISSVPYMIAFTAGGPIVQSGVLLSLAMGKVNQATVEFVQANGREPTLEEANRIQVWSAASVVAEKFGDMAAIKAIPIARLNWAKDVSSRVSKSLPASIANLAIVRPSLALTGEGVSGALTSVSEQMAATGEVADTDQVAFDALAEAMGTPGGVGAMVGGKAAYGAAKGATKAIVSPEEATTVTPDPNAPVGTPENPVQAPVATPEQAAAQEAVQQYEANDAAVSKIESEKPTIDDAAFDEQFKVIRPSELSNPIEQAVALEVINRLQAHELTPEQQARLETVFNEIRDQALQNTQDEELGSLKRTIAAMDEASKEDIERAKADPRTTPEEAEQLDRIQETKINEDRVREVSGLTGKNITIPKTQAEVDADVKEGSADTKWTGFKTYARLISAARENTEGLPLANAIKKVEALTSSMNNFLDNRKKRLAAIQEAKARIGSVPAGKEIVLRSYKGENWTSDNRVIDYAVEEHDAGYRDSLPPEEKQYVYKANPGIINNLERRLEAEVTYGQSMVDMVTEFGDSPINLRAQDIKRAEARVAQLTKAIDGRRDKTKYDAPVDVDSIGKPEETKDAPEAAKEAAPEANESKVATDDTQTGDSVRESKDTPPAREEPVQKDPAPVETEESGSEQLSEQEAFSRGEPDTETPSVPESTEAVPERTVPEPAIDESAPAETVSTPEIVDTEPEIVSSPIDKSRRLDEASWSQQSFQAVFPEIFNEEGEMLSKEEIGKDPKKVDAMAKLGRMLGVCR